MTAYKNTPIIIAVLALTTVTASAHPGHPGHEDWPFDDFKAIAFTITALITLTLLIRFRKKEA